MYENPELGVRIQRNTQLTAQHPLGSASVGLENGRLVTAVARSRNRATYPVNRVHRPGSGRLEIGSTAGRHALSRARAVVVKVHPSTCSTRIRMPPSSGCGGKRWPCQLRPGPRRREANCVPILTEAQLAAALAHIRDAPATGGTLELIVARPSVDERALLDHGVLDLVVGLVGDSWSKRVEPRASPLPDPERQLTVINARFSRLIGGDDAGAALAGDELHVDLDLSEHNARAGTRLGGGRSRCDP